MATTAELHVGQRVRVRENVTAPTGTAGVEGTIIGYHYTAEGAPGAAIVRLDDNLGRARFHPTDIDVA